jgi:murein DD-endopeptidase MepM/ murein hydrolase activator NlpD
MKAFRSRKSGTRKLSRTGSLALGLSLCASSSLAIAQFAGTGVDQKLVEARALIQRGNARKVEIAEQLARIEPRKVELRERVLRDGRSLYRVSRGGLLPMAGGVDALLGHASRLSRLERLVATEARELAGLDKKKLALRKEESEWDLRLSQAERELATLSQARVALAQQAATQSMFDQAFMGAAPQRTPSERPNYGLSVVGGMVNERFTAQRGNLALPVSGPNSIRDAQRAESDGPGLEFVCTHGAAVRAAAAGRVAFAERYGSYGQIIILDHGDRFYTVYGGLARAEVQVGDELSKSARIGSAGVDPVYFEVRHGTKTQEARGWLGL